MTEKSDRPLRRVQHVDRINPARPDTATEFSHAVLNNDGAASKSATNTMTPKETKGDEVNQSESEKLRKENEQLHKENEQLRGQIAFFKMHMEIQASGSASHGKAFPGFDTNYSTKADDGRGDSEKGGKLLR